MLLVCRSFKRLSHNKFSKVWCKNKQIVRFSLHKQFTQTRKGCISNLFLYLFINREATWLSESVFFIVLFCSTTHKLTLNIK